MASVVSILVSARNQTATAWRSAQSTATTALRAVANSARSTSQALRNISPAQITQTARAAGDLRQQANQAARQVEDLERLIRQLGGSAGPQLHAALYRARQEAERLARAARRADINLRRMTVQRRLVDMLAAATSKLRDAGTGAATAMAPLAGKIAGVLAFVVPLVPAVANLLGLLQLAVPAAFTAGAAFLTLKVGLQGVKDAVSAGLSGDAEAFNTALKKLSPSAQRFTKHLVGLAPAWRAIQKATQEKLFEGSVVGLKMLADVYLPKLKSGLPQLASLFAATFGELASFLSGRGARDQLSTIFLGVKHTIKSLLGMVQPLLAILLDIGEVAAPRLALMADGWKKAMDRAAEFIDKARESGDLGKWLDKGKETLQKIWDIGKEVFNTLKGIFTAGEGEDTEFLDKIKESLQKLSDWAQGPDGQSFFRGLASAAEAIAGIGNAIEGLSEKFATVRRWLRDLGGAGEGAAGRIAGAFAGAGMVLGGLVTTAWRVAGGINAALNSIRTFVGITIGYQQQGYARAINPGGSGGGGGRGPSFRAAGGLATGRVWVGERGPELLDLGARGGRVHSNEASQRMAAPSGQRQTVHVTLEPRPGLQRDLSDAIIRNLAVRAQNVGGWDRLIAGVT